MKVFEKLRNGFGSLIPKFAEILSPFIAFLSCKARGSQTFLYRDPFQTFSKFPRPKNVKLQQILNKITILVDFGNPKEAFGDPKKGRDPQFEKRCVRQQKTGFRRPAIHQPSAGIEDHLRKLPYRRGADLSLARFSSLKHHHFCSIFLLFLRTLH